MKDDYNNKLLSGRIFRKATEQALPGQKLRKDIEIRSTRTLSMEERKVILKRKI